MTPAAQSVSFPSGGVQLAGYLARPAGEGPHPGVVVIHEIFGLNDNMREIADRFAAAGYVALAVDLFAGRSRAVCMARLMAGGLLNPLQNGGVRDLRAALTFLTGQQGVDAARVGAVGYCLGGALAIAWACTDRRLRAVAPYYGMNPRPLRAVARACPVVGSYPERDFTAGQGRKLDAALAAYGVPHDVKIYPGTRHSFFNNTLPAYDPAAAEDSWQRVLAFFQEHLGATGAQGTTGTAE